MNDKKTEPMNKPTTSQAAWMLYAASAIAISLAIYLKAGQFGALIVTGAFLLLGAVILAVIATTR